MRTIHELLVLLKEHYIEEDCAPGLCHVIENMTNDKIISPIEYIILTRYLYANLPKNRKNDLYYWKKYQKRWRIYWLNKHIAIQATITKQQ